MSAPTTPHQEQQRREREAALLALFLSLLSQAEERIGELVAALVARTLTPADFGQQFQALLETAHTHAGYLGRQLAGDADALGAADETFGTAQAAAEGEFLASFVQDIEAGRYTRPGVDGAADTLSEKAILARALMYAGALLGSANEAWGEALPAETELWWRLGSEAPCPDCPELEAGSPYTPASIPTWPAAGATTCHGNCRCVVETSTGRSTFNLSARGE